MTAGMTRPIMAVLALLALMPPSTAGAQVDRVVDPDWTTPRTPDGHPDLQGLWGNKTITPTERPASAGGRAYLTDEEMAAAHQERVRTRDAQDAAAARRTSAGGRVGAYGSYWLDGGDTVLSTGQTSLIVDRLLNDNECRFSVGSTASPAGRIVLVQREPEFSMREFKPAAGVESNGKQRWSPVLLGFSHCAKSEV